VELKEHWQRWRQQRGNKDTVEWWEEVKGKTRAFSKRFSARTTKEDRAMMMFLTLCLNQYCLQLYAGPRGGRRHRRGPCGHRGAREESL
jgi:hypothetical protein